MANDEDRHANGRQQWHVKQLKPEIQLPDDQQRQKRQRHELEHKPERIFELIGRHGDSFHRREHRIVYNFCR